MVAIVISGDISQSVHIVASEGLEAYLPLADMVDVSSEIQRLTKRLSKMKSEYDALVARLNAPSVCCPFSLLFRKYVLAVYTIKYLIKEKKNKLVKIHIQKEDRLVNIMAYIDHVRMHCSMGFYWFY